MIEYRTGNEKDLVWEKLYDRLGFKTIKKVGVWPLNRVVMNLPFNVVHFMV